jgi:hypothetical protein
LLDSVKEQGADVFGDPSETDFAAAADEQLASVPIALRFTTKIPALTNYKHPCPSVPSVVKNDPDRASIVF